MKKLSNSNSVFNFCSEHKPVISIESGETIIVETLDARCGKMKSAEDIIATEPDFSEKVPKVNPASGPIAVKGAVPGDAICITIIEIELEEQGFILAKPNFGVIGDLVKETEAEFIPIRSGMAFFKRDINIPVSPMLGVIATAPKDGSIATAHVGVFGGNLDCKRITVGSKVYLPVFIPEAFIYVGDIHALMGDGEVSGTGIEVGGKVKMEINLISNLDLSWPYIETDELYITLGSGSSLYKAMRIALNNMLDYLQSFGFSRKEAYTFCSALCDVRLNQACDSPVDISLRIELKKSILSQIKMK